MAALVVGLAGVIGLAACGDDAGPSSNVTTIATTTVDRARAERCTIERRAILEALQAYKASALAGGGTIAYPPSLEALVPAYLQSNPSERWAYEGHGPATLSTAPGGSCDLHGRGGTTTTVDAKDQLVVCKVEEQTLFAALEAYKRAAHASAGIFEYPAATAEPHTWWNLLGDDGGDYLATDPSVRWTYAGGGPTGVSATPGGDCDLPGL